MVKVSNEALALLMVSVLIVTVGAVISLSWMEGGITGRVTDSGTASVNITQDVTIKVLTNVSFGGGVVDTGGCALLSNDTKPACWTNSTPYNPNNFIIKNLGNAVLNLSINASNSAADFINGTSPEYNYSWIDCTAGCTAIVTEDQWDPMPLTETPFINWSAGSRDQNVTVAIRLFVPDDTNGYKTSTVQFKSTAI